MRHGIFYIVFVFLSCLASTAWALDDLLPRTLGENSIVNKPQKSVLVVEFREKAPVGSKLSDAIQQGAREFSSLESILLPDEHALEGMLEAKADSGVGMVVLIHPQDMESFDKLLPLYPDLHFTLIDAPQASYAMNAQNVQFKQDEGLFLLGAIAGIRNSGRVTVMAMDNDATSQHAVEIFGAGVKHIHPEIEVQQQLGVRPSATQHTRLASAVTAAFQQGTAVLFSQDDEIIEQGLRAAKLERKMVISGSPPTASMDTSRLLTYLVKRYDLALMDVLRIYNHNQWHAGKIELGISGGYIDYSLNADNVEIFPKDAIDQIETLKDYIGQGMYTKGQ